MQQKPIPVLPVIPVKPTDKAEELKRILRDDAKQGHLSRMFLPK